MESVTYSNRHNDKIVFTRIEENKFLMQGGQYMRFGWNSNEDIEKKRYIYVDPSGGPYISKGMTMGYVFKGWLRKIVDYITHDDSNNDLVIITHPESIVKAKVNRKDVFRIYSADGRIIETLDNFNDAVKWIEDKYERR